MDAAQLIRKARAEAGLSQRELAARAGTSQPAVARYERGEAIPSLPTLERLLRACDRRLVLETAPTDRGAPPRPSSLRACTGPRATLLRRNRRALLDLARRRGARNVRVFGSLVRGEETAASDVDLLVELGDEATLLDLVRFRREARELLKVPVDIVTPEILKDRIRSRVEREAVPV